MLGGNERSISTEERRSLIKPIAVIISASGLYPLKGIYYFIAHPFLYPLLGARLIPLTLLSILTLGLLFTFTYLPQVAFLAIFHGSLAWVNGAFLVLGEGAVLIALLFEAFMVDETLVDIFDAVLIEQGMLSLVSGHRPINNEGENPVKKLGKRPRSAIYAPFSFRQILEFIVCLPFNLIPVVGTPVFLILTGYRGGPFHHWRYFKLLGYSRKERKAAIQSRRWKYTWFGIIALLLQLVPVIQMFFLLTTAAGAALWAVKLEQKRRLMEGDSTSVPSYGGEQRLYRNNPA